MHGGFSPVVSDGFLLARSPISPLSSLHSPHSSSPPGEAAGAEEDDAHAGGGGGEHGDGRGGGWWGRGGDGGALLRGAGFAAGEFELEAFFAFLHRPAMVGGEEWFHDEG